MEPALMRGYALDICVDLDSAVDHELNGCPLIWWCPWNKEHTAEQIRIVTKILCWLEASR